MEFLPSAVQKLSSEQTHRQTDGQTDRQTHTQRDRLDWNYYLPHMQMVNIIWRIQILGLKSDKKKMFTWEHIWYFEGPSFPSSRYCLGPSFKIHKGHGNPFTYDSHQVRDLYVICINMILNTVAKLYQDNLVSKNGRSPGLIRMSAWITHIRQGAVNPYACRCRK